MCVNSSVQTDRMVVDLQIKVRELQVRQIYIISNSETHISILNPGGAR